MRLPELSHLQVAVLGVLVAGEQRGRDVREWLSDLRVRQMGPAFYQMMSRLEDAGLAQGWYSQQVVAGQVIKERHYRITAAGRRAWREAHEFYRHLLATSEAAHA